MFVKILITVLCGAKATLSVAKATLSVVKATFSEAKATVSVAIVSVAKATSSEARAISSEARVSEVTVSEAKAIADAVVSVATVRQSDHLLENTHKGVPKRLLELS